MCYLVLIQHVLNPPIITIRFILRHNKLVYSKGTTVLSDILRHTILFKMVNGEELFANLHI